MRQIKFRQWFEKYKTFHYWGLIKSTKHPFVGRLTRSQNPREESFSEQFTGAEDTNGGEIFEGDFLQSYDLERNQKIHRVFWDNETCGFRLWLRNYGDAGSLKQWWIRKFGKEIIGNIHENLELVKQEADHAEI